MKKITFKLETKTEQNIIPLMKEIDKISCRLDLNMEDNIIIVQDVSDNMIETVIDLIKKYYSISEMDIDNVFPSVNNSIEAQFSDDSSKYHWVFGANFEGKYLKPIIKDFIEHSEQIISISKTLKLDLQIS